MIVPSMTVNEVLKELVRDFECIRRKSSVQGKLLQKEMLRKGMKQQTVSISCKTSRRNDWNIVFQMSSQDIKTSFYVKAADKVGVVVYSFIFENVGTANEEIYLLKYYKHFFDRYNERLALDFTETSKTIRYFFKKNFDFDLSTTPQIENGLCCCHLAYSDGLGISWKNEEQKTYHLKTFVSSDMFTKNQQQMVDYMRNDDLEDFSCIIKLAHLRKVV